MSILVLLKEPNVVMRPALLAKQKVTLVVEIVAAAAAAEQTAPKTAEWREVYYVQHAK